MFVVASPRYVGTRLINLRWLSPERYVARFLGRGRRGRVGMRGTAVLFSRDAYLPWSSSSERY